MDMNDNVKPYDDMSEWQRQCAIGSARYILEDVSMEKLAEITGLPMGVIAAAFDNIFVSKAAVDEPKRTTPPKRLRLCKCGCGKSIGHKHLNAKFYNQKHKDRHHNTLNPRGKFSFMNPTSPDYEPEWDRHPFDIDQD